MSIFNKEELRKIATLSALKIAPEQEDLFVEQIETILGYVNQLENVVADTSVQMHRKASPLRDDVAVKTDSELILALAPERENTYFVVPTILEEGGTESVL